MINLIKINLFKRISTLIVFVPLILYSVYAGGLTLAIFFIILLSIITYEISNMLETSKNILLPYLYLAISIISLYMFIFLVLTEYVSFYLFIKVILIIWMFDTFCYLGGSILKGRKLYPKVSSGKTISGLFTGIIFTITFTLIYSILFKEQIISNIIISVLIIALSFFGDTLASYTKRNANVKDSGNILPGHGGVIDRMDSFILVFLMIGLFFLTK